MPSTAELDEKVARYEQIVRNLDASDIVAIESGKPLSATQLTCVKITAARTLWDEIQREKNGTDDGRQDSTR
jgi:hypothetical protein